MEDEVEAVTTVRHHHAETAHRGCHHDAATTTTLRLHHPMVEEDEMVVGPIDAHRHHRVDTHHMARLRLTMAVTGRHIPTQEDRLRQVEAAIILVDICLLRHLIIIIILWIREARHLQGIIHLALWIIDSIKDMTHIVDQDREVHHRLHHITTHTTWTTDAALRLELNTVAVESTVVAERLLHELRLLPLPHLNPELDEVALNPKHSLIINISYLPYFSF